MVEVVRYDPTLHHERSASRKRCGQGGADFCATPPEFTVLGPHTISACPKHLAGAVRQANGMVARAALRAS